MLIKTHIYYFRSCKRDDCYRKKLIDNRCPSCGVIYNPTTPAADSAIGKVLVNTGVSTPALTIFTQQLQELYDITEINMDLNHTEDLQNALLNKMPLEVHCNTRGAKVSTFKKLN